MTELSARPLVVHVPQAVQTLRRYHWLTAMMRLAATQMQHSGSRKQTYPAATCCRCCSHWRTMT